MKSSSIITFFIIMCLLVSGRADALTLEARAAIEEMRSKLCVNVSPVEKRVEPSEYIPGKDLEAALARLRQQFYGIDTSQITVSIVADQVPSKAPMVEQASVVDQNLIEQQASVPYIPGNLLSQALAKVRNQQGRENKPVDDSAANCDSEKVVVAPEVLTPVAEPVIMPDVAPVPAPVTEVATSTEIVPKPAKTSDDLLEAAEKAVEVSSSVKPVVEKKQEKAGTVKKSSNKKIRQETHEKSKTVSEPEKEDKTDAVEPAKPEDQEFNEFIRRYDFKMPENYRIIVR